MNSHIQKLIATLKQLPPEWPLVPSRYKKPLGYFWQERPFTPRQLIQGLLAGGITVVNKNRQPYQVLPTGFGLLTGYPLKDGDQTYYLMALDQDGPSATTAVAHAPEWLLKLMRPQETKRSNYKPTKTSSCLGKPYRKQQRLPSFQIHPTTANKARKL